MTVIDMERLIRAYWSEPIRSPLLEAARFARIVADVVYYLAPVSWKLLYLRLGGRRQLGSGVCPGMVLERLSRLIDRRPRLGICPPKPSFDDNARQGRDPARGRRDCRGRKQVMCPA